MAASRRPAPRGKPTHGGARIGAGARPGNLNAVKTGRRSIILRRAVEKLMEQPTTAAAFGALCAFVIGDTAAARRHLQRALSLTAQPPTP